MNSPWLGGCLPDGALRELVLRRFLWHDRIHARAMYRRAGAVWDSLIPDPFRFDH